MNRVTGPYGNYCTVTLELPWEVAESLVEHGPKLLADLGLAVKMRKQRTDYHLEASRQADFEQNKREFYNLGKEIHERLRNQIDAPVSNKVKAEILRKLAAEYGTTSTFLDDARRLYLADIKKEKNEIRDAQVIRLFFQGLTNKDIARRVKTSPTTVAKVLSKEKDLISALRRVVTQDLRKKGGVK